MANKNYRRGYKKEMKVVNNYRDNGNYATRTAGSHSCFDVIAFMDEEVHAIQVKRTKKKKKFTQEIITLRNIKVPWNVHKFLWVWRDYEGWVVKKHIRGIPK